MINSAREPGIQKTTSLLASGFRIAAEPVLGRREAPIRVRRPE
jgi:hypothetical protein